MIICSYCKQQRLSENASCTYCGAPASMIMQSNTSVSAWSWSQSSLAQPTEVGASPFSSLSSRASSFPPVSSSTNFSLGRQANGGQTQQQDGSKSLVPLSQQGGMGLQQALQSTFVPGPLVPMQPSQETSIAIPPQEGVIYVPPMYTKPRPIIPLYRVISGLLSFLIVCLLLCGVAGYYAKTSGTLDLVNRFITGGNPPPNIQAKNVALPDPPNKIDKGPAYSVIPSATTTSHLIQNSSIAAQTDKAFQPNQQFALTYSVYPPTQGKVITKWYTNGVLFQTIATDLIPKGTGTSGLIKIAYPEQAEGMVELYWTDQTGNVQFAQRLYFVVRN